MTLFNTNQILSDLLRPRVIPHKVLIPISIFFLVSSIIITCSTQNRSLFLKSTTTNIIHSIKSPLILFIDQTWNSTMEFKDTLPEDIQATLNQIMTWSSALFIAIYIPMVLVGSSYKTYIHNRYTFVSIHEDSDVYDWIDDMLADNKKITANKTQFELRLTHERRRVRGKHWSWMEKKDIDKDTAKVKWSLPAIGLQSQVELAEHPGLWILPKETKETGEMGKTESKRSYELTVCNDWPIWKIWKCGDSSLAKNKVEKLVASAQAFVVKKTEGKLKIYISDPNPSGWRAQHWSLLGKRDIRPMDSVMLSGR